MVITHSPTKRSIVFNHNDKISFCVTNAHTEGKCAARQKNKPDLTRVIAESSVPEEVIIKHLSVIVLLESVTSRKAMSQRQTSGTRNPVAVNSLLKETKSILHLIQDKLTGYHVFVSI